MNDFRCSQCNRLLAKIEGESRVEIKCPRCKTMNLYSQEIYITIKTSTGSIDPKKRKEDPCTDPEIAEA